MATTTKLMTIAELEREGAPEGRYELIDGKLVEMSPSDPLPSRIGILIAAFLVHHVLPGDLGGVFGAEAGFVIFPDRETVRVPDVAFVSKERLPSVTERGFYRLAPDLVVEVVSPSDRMRDVTAKAELWLEAGSRLVWVVDPPARSITVYERDRAPFDLGEADTLIGGEVLPEFQLPVHRIFPS